jgi:hypothetical protein
MQLRIVGDHAAELYQAPSPHFALESCQRYELLEDGTIELTVECIPRKKSFTKGYVGLFWASYIHAPPSGAIHFKGHAASEDASKIRWIESISKSHGDEATHLAHDDTRVFPHEKEFAKRLRLVFGLSRWRYREPWYYGRHGDVAFVQMFRPGDRVRLAQSPSGGGRGNPAWDFQYYIENYEVGRRYQLVMRAKLLPFRTPEQIEKDTEKHRRELGQR